MQFGVVWLLLYDHAKEDLEQSLSQAPQSGGVRHALVTFLFVVDPAPGAGLAETVGPQVDGMAQKLVACPTDLDLADLAGLEGDGGGSGDGLKHFVRPKAIGIVAHHPQQARSQNILGSRQAAKQIVIGMVFKDLPDLTSIELELLA